MCRVLIRIQLFFIVCTHASFDHGGRHFLLAWNLLASGRKWLHSFIPPLSFLSLSFDLHPTTVVSCQVLHIPHISLIPHFCSAPNRSQSPLTIFSKSFTRRKLFPVCLLCRWYHQLGTHILPRAAVLPSWHKTNTDLGMSTNTPGWGVISGAPDQTPPFTFQMKSLQL